MNLEIRRICIHVHCGILIFFPLLIYAFTLEDRTPKTWLLPTHKCILNIVLMFVCLFEEMVIYSVLLATTNKDEVLICPIFSEVII